MRDDHHPDQHRRDDADRLPRARRPRTSSRRGMVGCAIARAHLVEHAAHRARAARRPSSGAARSSRASRPTPTRSGDLAIWPFSRASLSRLGVGSRSSARCRRPSACSGGSVAERRDRVAHEVAERGRDRAGARPRRRPARSTTRSGNASENTLRFGAARDEQAERDLGEEQAREHRARDLDRGDEELAEVLASAASAIVARSRARRAGTTSNERKKPLTRMRYAFVVKSSVIASSS